MNPYLPSKKFLYRTIVILVLAVTFFGLYKLSIFFINKFSKKQQSSLTVSPGGTIEKDSNGNGIPDWEETLWGLDPTKDGNSNKAIIEKNKAALAQSSDGTNTTSDSTSATDSDETSREFFAAIMSLQASGNLNDTSIQAVADSIGQKVAATPIPDMYHISDIKTETQTDKHMTAYYVAIVNLFGKYKDKSIGNELTFINQGLANNDPGAMKIATEVAYSYESFGKDLIATPVPPTLAQNHLDMANNYEKTGETIEAMAKVLSDPITAMNAFINYKKYSDLLASDINHISDSL